MTDTTDTEANGCWWTESECTAIVTDPLAWYCDEHRRETEKARQEAAAAESQSNVLAFPRRAD